MSVKGLIDVAIQRDLDIEPVRLEHQPRSRKRARAVEAQGYGDLLITAIPVEPLALYTFLVAGIFTTIRSDANQHLTMRWIIYGVSALFIAVWILTSFVRAKETKRRYLPVVEILSGVVAFCAWGLIMPESPLAAELSSKNQTIWTFIITAAGVAALGLLTGSMKKPASPMIRDSD
jgi:hypothetical protein